MIEADEWIKRSILISLRSFFSGLLSSKTIIKAFKNLFHCVVICSVMDSKFTQFLKKNHQTTSGINLCHEKHLDENVVVCDAGYFRSLCFSRLWVFSSKSDLYSVLIKNV